MLNQRQRHLPRRTKSFLTLICVVVLTGVTNQTGYAQPISLKLSLLTDQLYQIYNISDFDIAGGGGAIDLFNCEVTSNLPYKLRLTIVSDRFPGSPFVEARSGELTGNLVLTYRNFRALTLERFVYNPQQLESLSNAILQTGRLPSGRYDITVAILNPDSNQPYRDSVDNPIQQTVSLIISNPISLDLISPGQNAGVAECPTLFSTLPQFTWNSDADKFIITVCEYLPTNSSPEDVMQNAPRVRMTLRRNQDFFGSPSFQYPTGGLPLLPGRIYYWQVLALLQTASGEVQLPSEIWCFKIHNNDGVEDQLQLQQLMNLLASLGLQDLLELFKPGGPLAGYKPNGKILVNGKNVDLAELLVLLQNGSIKIKGYNVE